MLSGTASRPSPAIEALSAGRGGGRAGRRALDRAHALPDGARRLPRAAWRLPRPPPYVAGLESPGFELGELPDQRTLVVVPAAP